MTDSYNRIFTFKLILLLFQIFLIFPKIVAAFPMRTLASFSQLSLYVIYWRYKLLKQSSSLAHPVHGLSIIL